MKRSDNRQNPFIERSSPARHFSKLRPAGASETGPSSWHALSPGGGVVYGLITDVLLATKIAQAAKLNHMTVHHFDQVGPLMEHVAKKAPALIVLDWESREAEAFKVLQALAVNPEFKKIPSVGFVSSGKTALVGEAQRAGCHRVYFKSEFLRELAGILMRYAL